MPSSLLYPPTPPSYTSVDDLITNILLHLQINDLNTDNDSTTAQAGWSHTSTLWSPPLLHIPVSYLCSVPSVDLLMYAHWIHTKTIYNFYQEDILSYMLDSHLAVLVFIHLDTGLALLALYKIFLQVEHLHPIINHHTSNTLTTFEQMTLHNI